MPGKGPALVANGLCSMSTVVLTFLAAWKRIDIRCSAMPESSRPESLHGTFEFLDVRRLPANSDRPSELKCLLRLFSQQTSLLTCCSIVPLGTPVPVPMWLAGLPGRVSLSSDDAGSFRDHPRRGFCWWWHGSLVSTDALRK